LEEINLKHDIAISIVVPVYNVEKYLKKCLDSLLNQTLDEIEIILVDDCSTDSSKDIMNQYRDAHPDKIVIYQTDRNSRQGTARNLGTKCANGDYIMYVDSDDWLELDACALLYRKAAEENCDIVYGMYQEVRGDGSIKKCGACIYEEQLKPLNHDSILLNHHYPWGKLIKRELIVSNHLYFPEHLFFEDVVTGPLYGFYGKRIQFVPGICYNYLQRGDSVMHAMTTEKLEQEMHCGEMFLEECKKRGLLDSNQEAVMAKYFMSACMYPYLHSGKGVNQIILNKIEDLIAQNQDLFLQNRYIQYRIEDYIREALLHTTCKDSKIRNCFVDYMKAYSNIAVWGAGIKGRDFVKTYQDDIQVKYIIDKNPALQHTRLETGQEIVSLEECKECIDAVIVVNENYYYDIAEEIRQHKNKLTIINYEVIIDNIISHNI
jgi:glycosyltransferase involved in cell wall biosynthesis